MNPIDRIQSDAILYTVPAREVAKWSLWGGYDIPRAPGRVAVLVQGNRARVLTGSDMKALKDELDGSVVYLRTGATDVSVGFTEADAVQTAGSYPCVGEFRLQAVVPEEGAELKAFVLAHVGKQVYGPEDVAGQVRAALLGSLRQAVRELSLEQVAGASERICDALSADSGGRLAGALQAQGLRPGRAWSLDLRPGAYSEGDQEAFEEVFEEAEALLEAREGPASKVIHSVMALHNPAPSFRVNLWLSRLEDRPPTRGAIEVYAEATHKDAGMYRRGEAISLDVLCSRDAYLYLFDLDCEGELSLLFPNALHRENRIPGGEVFRLPDDMPGLFGGQGQRWEVLRSAPRGVERVKAIATSRPVELLPEILGRSSLLYCRPAADALPDVVKMVEKVRKLASSGWADGACQFHVA